MIDEDEGAIAVAVVVNKTITASNDDSNCRMLNCLRWLNLLPVGITD